MFVCFSHRSPVTALQITVGLMISKKFTFFLGNFLRTVKDEQLGDSGCDSLYNGSFPIQFFKTQEDPTKPWPDFVQKDSYIIGPIREKLSQDMKRVDVDATNNHVDRLHDLIYEQISGKYMLLLILKENERKL